jgi:hypothetical protein
MAFDQAFLGSDTLVELFHGTVRSILSVSAMTQTCQALSYFELLLWSVLHNHYFTLKNMVRQFGLLLKIHTSKNMS